MRKHVAILVSMSILMVVVFLFGGQLLRGQNQEKSDSGQAISVPQK